MPFHLIILYLESSKGPFTNDVITSFVDGPKAIN